MLHHFSKPAVLIITSLIFVTVLASCSSTRSSNVSEHNKESKGQLPLVQDEFAELDEQYGYPYAGDNFVATTLENARLQYLDALSSLTIGDTLQAARSFESAINVLNTIVDFPNIEENTEFTDLMQSILEDYDTYVQSIDNLDENSSVFILRNKLFQAVDAEPLTDEAAENAVEQLVIPEPVAGERVDILGMTTDVTVPLPNNVYVQKAIKFFTTNKGRKFFRKWLERAGRWFPMMRQIAQEEGVPEELIHVSMFESGLNPNAVSPAKAVGLWQFIKSTGEMYDLNANYWTDDRRNPEKSTRAAMQHLRDLYEEFGDWHLAFAAYNYGSGGVRRAIRRSRKDNPDFWQIRRYLPRETRNYVPLFIATVTIVTNREKYGFTEIEFEPQYKYDTFEISEAVDLSALAKCAGIAVEDLEMLNPELLRECTPPNVENYELKIPVGTHEAFAVNYPNLPDEEKRSWILHTVKRRETLRSIAKQYGSSSQLIAVANDLKGRNKRLRTGELLRIPLPKMTEELKQQIAENSKKEKEQAAAVSSQSGNKKKIYHRIRRGQTLAGIARRYGVRIADLRNWNNIPYKDRIQANSTLVVYVNDNGKNSRSKTELSKLELPEIVHHKVRRGETVAKIADTYGVSIKTIRAHNRLNRRNTIYVGQVLKVPTGKGKSTARRSTASTKSSTAGKSLRYHKVHKGETIGEIAEMYAVRTADIRNWNPNTVRGNRIYAGSRLKIYSNHVAKGSSSARKSGSAAKYYTVRRGDTLTSIARKFGISVNSIKSKNRRLNERALQIGQKIRVQ